MSILFISLMGGSLFLPPLWTHLRFQEAYLLEKATIAMDNVSIRIGQSFREALEVLQKGRWEILALEKLHHVSHLCAVAPNPLNAPCKVEDARMELQIQGKRVSILSKAQAAWQKGSALASRESQKLEATIQWDRPQELPVRSRLCSVCRKPAEWIPVLPWEARVYGMAGDRKLSNRVKAIHRQTSASYQVWGETGNE